MRITSATIPDPIAKSKGLQPVRMKKLGKVVLIAGKNGAGKTRLLNAIRAVEERYANPQERSTVLASIVGPVIPLGLDRPPTEKEIELHAKDTERRDKEIKRLVETRPWLEVHGTEQYRSIHCVPKNLGLEDPYHMTASDAINRASGIMDGDVNQTFDQLPQSALATIQVIQNRAREATHQDSTLDSETKRKWKEDYENLNGIVFALLGVSIGRSPTGDATIFGFRIGESYLSEGQRVLLQISVAIHAQGLGPNFGSAIFLLDEPENHLHPSAMLEVIDAIHRRVTTGQVWIATHSIPLLSYFEDTDIWWMESGRVNFAGNVPRKVLQGLLGDEDRILKMADFLNLPFTFASNRFALQCLTDPGVVDTDADDPQTTQISEILKAIGFAKLRLLDFGAGRGRLVSALAACGDAELQSDKIEYFAFDADATHREACLAAIGRFNKTPADHYFNTESSLFTKLDPESVDVIVMCNVLHEIPANDWLRLFSADAIIRRLLKPSGKLVIVEDLNLPVGEKPHQKGFLVLDTPQIKTLFSITEADERFTETAARNGRLKAYQIPSDCLSRLTAETRKKAIEQVCHAAHGEILRLRNAESSYQNGRLHGFWVQQYANGKLTLAELG